MNKIKYKRRLFIPLIVIFILIIGIVVWFYTRINPENHFKDIDAVVEPSNSTTNKSSTNDNTTTDSKNTKQTQKAKPINVLLLGLDGEENEKARTDVIMVVHINPITKKISLLSVPRDTQVQLPGIGNTKINHAYYMAELKGGAEAGTNATTQAVANLLDIPIHYYLTANFTSFTHFIDSIGGVTVNLPKTIKIDNVTLTKGKHLLDGELALSFVRERYSLANGEFGRQEDQALILYSIAQKLLSTKNIPKFPTLITEIKKDIEDTNLNESDILSLAVLFSNISEEQVQYFQIPGVSKLAKDPIVKTELYYWIPNMDKVKEIVKTNFRNK